MPLKALAHHFERDRQAAAADFLQRFAQFRHPPDT
jgi:hypothetical protein